MRAHPTRLLALVAAASLALAGCTATATAPDPAPAASDETLQGTLTIYAAASLAAPFGEIATAFTDANPDVTVAPLVVDGSNTLARQIIAGAPADVLATADEASMATVADAGLLADAAMIFTTNTLVIVVPAGNPAGVRGPADLARDDVTFVQCASEVPCGAATGTLLELWGVAPTPASFEQNVTAVLTKVAAGEADAGLVYRTDAQNRDDVESVELTGAGADAAANVVNNYAIGTLGDSAAPALAAAFVAFVAGPDGQAILTRYGFGAP